MSNKPDKPETPGVVLLVGGLAESLVNFRAPLIRAIVSQGYRVIAVAPGPFSAETKDALCALGAEPVDVELNRLSLNPLRDLRFFWAIRSLVRRVRPCAFLAYTVKPVVFGGLAAWVGRVPSRVAWITGLGNAFSGGTGIRSVLLKFVVGNLYRVSLATYHCVLFQNRDDLDLFRCRRIIGSRRRVAITAGSGIDTRRYAISALPDGPVFLMAARLLIEKGVYDFVAAAEELKRRYPNARFLLAGDTGWGSSCVTEEEVETWRQRGTIEYLGWVKDIRPVLAECRVFVLPSFYREGVPRSVLEALSMGRPVITTDSPGCRDTIEHDRSGKLIPVRDPKALAAAMEQFILDKDLAVRFGVSARARAVEVFDVEKVSAVVMRHLGLEVPS